VNLFPCVLKIDSNKCVMKKQFILLTDDKVSKIFWAQFNKFSTKFESYKLFTVYVKIYTTDAC
jgi:hypothetical protein